MNRLFLIAAFCVCSAMVAESATHLGPSAVAVGDNAKTIWVACADSREVLWVKPATGTITRRVETPGEPTDLLLNSDDGTMFVACASPYSIILKLDAITGRTIRRYTAGHTASAVAFDEDQRRLYVCNRFNNDVSIIDEPTGRLLARVPVDREPIDIAVANGGKTIVVANHLANQRTNVDVTEGIHPLLTLIDAETQATKNIPLPSGANSIRGLCVAPGGRHVFVTHLLSNFQELPIRVTMGWINTNVVSVVDLKEKKVCEAVGLDDTDLGAANPWGICLAEGGESVCVSLSGTHQVAHISVKTLLDRNAQREMAPMMGAWPVYTGLGDTYWSRVAVTGNGPRYVAAAGSKVFVTQHFSDSICMIDLSSPADSKLETIPLGPPPEPTLERRGERYFHDATLCYRRWQSCASCHPDGRADALTWDLLNDGVGNPKNTKSLLLSHQTPPSMATGVRAKAEVAVRKGMTHILFAHRPPAAINEAIDAYLRSLTPTPSPRLVEGEFSESANRGRELFESKEVGCYRCHPAPLFTDMKLHRITPNALGGDVRFDTPSLIETWRTGPYLHDGRYTTIEKLLREGKHGLSDMKLERLSDQNMKDLAEYVLSL
jgi:YVTN family beta-propeller protein